MGRNWLLVSVLSGWRVIREPPDYGGSQMTAGLILGLGVNSGAPQPSA